MELLLNMTIGGTVTACLILLIKQLLKSKLTPKWHFYIWIILALRLMIPGLPESDYSLLNTVPTAQNIAVVQNNSSDAVETKDSAESVYIKGNVIMRSPVTGSEQTRSFSVSERGVNFVLAGWGAGALLMAVYLIVVYSVFARRANRLPECIDAETLELFKECQAEAGAFTDRITLRLGGNTPMLQGILKPVILIPEGYSRDEMRHVLIHELCHYKHKDIFINILCSVFLCVYWFNPVFWLCFFTIRRDIEFLCDERVIEITGERREYSRTLLKTALKRNPFLFATTSMQNGEKEVSKRIKHIAYFKKPRMWFSVLAAVLVLVAASVCLTNASSVNSVNVDIGDGYFVKVPESWISNSSDELQFVNDKGESFGGAYYSELSLTDNKSEDLEAATLPLPNHSQVLERKTVKAEGFTLIVVNLDMDTETAAQIAERNASGDNSPSVKKNQNYIFIIPEKTRNKVFTVWADSNEVTERKLIKIAKTLRENPYPQGYQPERMYQDSWHVTGDKLLRDYFDNYVDSDMSMSSDISGYRIDKLEQYASTDDFWSIIYPNAAIMLVDYTLDIAYPDRYSFPGGGFEVGSGNKTKIYKDQLAVFQLDNTGKAKFMGFIWPQDFYEMGEAKSIIHTINYRDPAQSPEALLKLKMPYIGDHSGVGSILSSLPLVQYSTSLELHTKAEPYGLTVNYDFTELGDKVFEARPDRANTDSSGWDPKPYLEGQLFKNSAILLSLIDNCSTVEFKITGISGFGIPYTYSYFVERESLQKVMSKDPREFTDNLEDFTGFINELESIQMSY